MLKCINLSLSNRCNAKCIWCPKSRGTKNNFDLSYDIVVKIVDEISNPTFPFKVDMIHVSENGEALYNQDFLKILRYIKKKLPDISINFLSNFGLMTAEISETLLKEKLLTSAQVNIDGHNAGSYKAAKEISFKSVIKNVKYFLQMREKYDPNFDFCINVMPAAEYAITVSQSFHVLPDRLEPGSTIPFSTFESTKQVLRRFVPDNVRIRHSKSGLWSERKLVANGTLKFPVPNEELNCPLIDRVKSEAFIAPNGDWYACCLDDNNDLVLGNVLNSSILEIYNSSSRRQLIEKLEARKFDEIGYPCNAVAACQTISLPTNHYHKLTSNIPIGENLKF